MLGNDAREEILQDFYLSLLENDKHKLRAYRPDRGKLQSWLCYLAKNASIDHVRKVLNRPRLVGIEELLAQEGCALEEMEDADVRPDPLAKRLKVIDAHCWWLARQQARKEERGRAGISHRFVRRARRVRNTDGSTSTGAA